MHFTAKSAPKEIAEEEEEEKQEMDPKTFAEVKTYRRILGI